MKIGDAEFIMSISTEQLKKQAHFEAAHLKMMESMMQKFSSYFPDPGSSEKQSTSADAVGADLTEFIYDPNSGVPFDAWFKPWEDIFHVEFSKADDAWKTPGDAETRTGLLIKIEQDPDSTLRT
ncbi:unnamed protein product [Schistocephalus solidus]|uniref:T2SSG domain-containing protein n=1 Tax=Schistocephalus solidus TaxID=70667 RepID=A0A183SKA4_SCHSO|nr:unnamed protein product [Schistocephalus solidus]